MAQMPTDAKRIDREDVSFNPDVIAAAWEAFDDGIPAVCAAAIINEFTPYTVTANEGEEADRDVIFADAGQMVEEKAMGVCPKDVAVEYAHAYIELDRDDGKVLAMNGNAVFEDYSA